MFGISVVKLALLYLIFFRCFTFVHLRLTECCFKSLDVVCWKNLKSLNIVNSSFNEEVFKKILSGSPLLEKLLLSGCDSFQMLDITNESVKNFVIYGDSMQIDTLQINAPYIKYLRIEGEFDFKKLLLLNVSSVIKAKLDYSNDTFFYYNGEVNEDDPINQELLKGLILSLTHVKELKVGKSCLEVQLYFYLIFIMRFTIVF